MRATIPRVALVGVLTLVASATCAADTWLGAVVMPKSNQLRLQVGNAYTGNVQQISWPATVVKINSRWLWIRDEGGYNKSPVAGWVYADDVLRIEEAGDYYTEQLRADKQAWLYWLRGIYWEQQGKSAIAQADYEQALENSKDNSLDDVQIRLGRLIAKSQLDNGLGRYDESNRHLWEDHFKSAEKMNNQRAQLYLDWGDALSQACLCGEKAEVIVSPAPVSGDSPAPKTSATKPPDSAPKSPDGASKPQHDSLGKEASDKYAQAIKLSTNWWRVPFAQGELLFKQCDEESPDGYRMPKREFATDDTLGQAEKYFNQAIRWDANSCDPYRDLSEILRLQSQVLGRTNRLEEARQLATTACTISNYREDASLRTLAQIYADLKDFNLAVDYCERASEAATQESSAQKLVRLWLRYQQQQKDQQTVDESTRRQLALDQLKRDQQAAAGTLIAGQPNPLGATKGGGPDDPTRPNNTGQPPLLPPNFLLRSNSAYR